MDSITQAALGATVAGAIAGKQCNAKVLVAGAILGTLPDLDVILDYGDAISNTIKHRGFSHSLLLLPPFGLLLAWIYARLRPDPFWTLSRVSFLTISVLVTHALLDAMTTYGTQLIWPFAGYFEVSNIFIIDPLYTLPLLVAIVVALCSKKRAGKWCRHAVVLSSLYLVWGYVAQQHILQRVHTNLTAKNLPNQQILVMPTPLNTVLWRVVVMGEEQYWEGFASLLDDDPQIEFIARPLGKWPLAEQPKSLKGLKAFSHDFLSYREENDSLIVTDLRLGLANYLSFQFVIAQKDDANQWQVLAAPTRYPGERGIEHIGALWQRLKGDQSIDANLQQVEITSIKP